MQKKNEIALVLKHLNLRYYQLIFKSRQRKTCLSAEVLTKAENCPRSITLRVNYGAGAERGEPSNFLGFFVAAPSEARGENRPN